MAVSHLQCKECEERVSARGAVRVRALLRPARGRLRPRAAATSTSAELRRAHPGRPAEHLALRRLPAARRRSPGPSGRLASRVGLPAGCTPLVRADRLAERLGLREVWVKNDAANPTHSFKDRVVSVAVTRARELGFETIACASTGNLANSVAAHGAALGLDSYVFIPADLEEQKVLATGIYGTHLVGVEGQLRRRQPPVHRAVRRARLGVREHQPAPLLRRGLQDARVRDRRAARLGAPRPLRRADRLGLAVHEDRQRASPSGRELGLLERRAAADERRPGARAARRSRARSPPGADVCRPVKPDTIAKSLAIGNPADGPYALDLARRSGGSVDAVSDEEIREGIRLLAETTGSSPRPPAASRPPCSRSSPQRGDIDPDERVVLVITGEGLKTLDAVRGTFETSTIEPDRRGLRGGRAAAAVGA